MKGKPVHVSTACQVCGEPITVANKYGMFCKNLCNMQRSVDAEESVKRIFNTVFDALFDENGPRRKR